MLLLNTSFGKCLFMKFLCNFFRLEIFRVSHLPKKLLASSREFYSIRLETLFKPCIEVPFHTTNKRKRISNTKYNILRINALKAISAAFYDFSMLIRKGICKTFFTILKRPQNVDISLICRGLKVDCMV